MPSLKHLRTSLKGRIRRAVDNLVAPYLHANRFPMLGRVIPPDADRHGIALAAIVKNEARYISEWIAFHCMLGVRHIYLYDNLGTDDLASAVAASGFAERVTITRWGVIHPRPQNMAYNHCISTYGAAYRWLGFIDADEFVFPLKADSLTGAFQQFEDQPCVSLPWHMFGTSGHETRPEGLVIENFTMREAFPPSRGVKVCWKTFVDPARVKGMSIHVADIEGLGQYYITQTGLQFDRFSSTSADLYEGEELRINHYYTRSREDLNLKLTKGDASKGRAHDNTDHRLARANMLDANPLEDTSALRFAKPLKQAMKRKAAKKL